MVSNIFSFQELEARAQAVPALGSHARAFGPMDALMMACVHRVAHHHDDEHLVWIYDIHLLCGGLDASGLEALGRSARAKRVAAACGRSRPR